MKVQSLASLCLLSLLTACGEDGPNTRPLTSQEQALVSTSNTFGFTLFGETVAQSNGENIFISPLSVSLALGMTYNGARGTTADGMRTALDFGSLTNDEINLGYHGLIDLLIHMDSSVTLEIANAIWHRQGFPVLQDFTDTNQKYFDAPVTALDFNNPSAAGTINGWVSEKTHGKIEEIVDSPIDPALIMFLIDAIYFKGTWTYLFDPNNTSDAPFHISDTETKTVRMMHQHGELPFLSTPDFKAVNLPYGFELFNMSIILPNRDVAIDDVVQSLNQKNWAEWQAQFHNQEIDIALPKFELEYKTSLVSVLAALGMADAFDGNKADFTGITKDGGIYISDVKHKTYVKVNEEGTEAAAVTSVEMKEVSAGPMMQVDRPFLVVIHDKHSQALLFMGKIVDPG